jgi:hypothetical protein
MDYFDKLATHIQTRAHHILLRLKAYFKRLLFPLYLFPIKLISYSLYYLVKFTLKFILAALGLMLDTIIYPFRSLKHYLKASVVFIVCIYLFASLVVIVDYVNNQYGHLSKFFCGVGMRDKLQNSVVRIVGGYSEGSGFFVSDNQILTNFHVIADEPSPKIILPDGSFIAPTHILGNKDADLALIFITESFPDLVLSLPIQLELIEAEPLIAVGYPLGTDLSGKATIMKGTFIDFRQPKEFPVGFIQTDISLVQGMSGGPIVDQCGQVVGINTIGLAGLSLFITGDDALRLLPDLTDQGIAKIEVDPSISPEEAVKAFYTYLKARRMEDGYNLLSQEYLTKTSFEEWTSRFTDILDVDVIATNPHENTPDTAFVKFSTKNWVDQEAHMHFYEGTWQTVKEDEVYKMLKSNIKEIENPTWDWFY